MKRQLKSQVIGRVPLLNAVLCVDCEYISEATSDVCGVCGGRSLTNLGRLLGSAMQSAADVDVNEPRINQELQALVDSAVPRQLRRFP